MAYLHTCVGCLFQGAACTARDVLKIRIKGLGITSIRHRCPVRAPRYSAGHAVMIHTYDSKDDPDSVVMQWWPGWFISQKGTKAICFIRPKTEVGGYEFSPQHSNGFVKVPLSRVKIGAHDRVELDICRFCNGYPALDSCWGCDPKYAGADCLKRATPTHPATGDE